MTMKSFHRLCTFAKVSLAAGEAAEVELDIDAKLLTLTDASGARARAPGAWRVWVGNEGEADAIELVVE